MDEQKNIPRMEEKEYIEYLRNQLTESEASTPIAQLSVYDMNKDLVKGLKTMNNGKIDRALARVRDWFDPDETHYALLNHEHHYFTIFELGEDSTYYRDVDSFIFNLKDILTNYYGDNDLRSIDVPQEGTAKDGSAVEIWAMWDGEPTVAYLFPYSKGVVYY